MQLLSEIYAVRGYGGTTLRIIIRAFRSLKLPILYILGWSASGTARLPPLIQYQHVLSFKVYLFGVFYQWYIVGRGRLALWLRCTVLEGYGKYDR